MKPAHALTSAFLAIACAADSPSFSVRHDSLGTIIEYSTGFDRDAVPRWVADSSPILTLEDSTVQLFGVRAAAFLSGGRIVVANGGSGEILLYDPGGGLSSRSGGEGDGPGEFSGLTFLSVGPADSLFAYDSRRHRLSVFDPNGRFVRAVTLDGLEGLGAPDMVGALATGEIVGAFHRRSPGTGVVRDSLVVARFSTAGRMTSVVEVVPHGYTDWGPHRMPGGGEAATFPLPVPLSPLSEAAGGGGAIVLAVADRYELVRIDTGGVRTVTRSLAPPIPLTDEHLGRLFAELASDRLNPAELDVLRGLRGPKTLPRLGREPLTARLGEPSLIVSAAGDVWVAPFQVGGGTRTRWHVFGSSGRFEGTALVPQRFQPLAVRDDLVLGVRRDPDDVERIHAYRMRSPNRDRNGPAAR